MGGAWSIGRTDNAMLERIAGLIANYTIANYKNAIGGATGKPAEKLFSISTIQKELNK
jgi:hypothetical protein